jgi:hypothetical protein
MSRNKRADLEQSFRSFSSVEASAVDLLEDWSVSSAVNEIASYLFSCLLAKLAI